MNEIDAYIHKIAKNEDGGSMTILDFAAERELKIFIPPQRVGRGATISTRITRMGERRKATKFETLDQAIAVGLNFLENGTDSSLKVIEEAVKLINDGMPGMAENILSTYLELQKPGATK